MHCVFGQHRGTPAPVSKGTGCYDGWPACPAARTHRLRETTHPTRITFSMLSYELHAKERKLLQALAQYAQTSATTRTTSRQRLPAQARTWQRVRPTSHPAFGMQLTLTAAQSDRFATQTGTPESSRPRTYIRCRIPALIRDQHYTHRARECTQGLWLSLHHDERKYERQTNIVRAACHPPYDNDVSLPPTLRQ